ncbi:MAG TPA: hypothetical protein VLA42_18230 [Verrucomicrobiae bacterium]|nr:hypothetical protein [Verrucomicrobiae bacterium]
MWDRFTHIFTAGDPNYSDYTSSNPKYGQMQLITPEAAMTPGEQQRNPRWTGTGEVAGSLTTPESVAIMAGTGGLPGVPGAIGRIARPTVGAYFAGQMGQGAYNAHLAADQATDPSEKTRLNTQAVLSGLGAGLVGAGTLYTGIADTTAPKASTTTTEAPTATTIPFGMKAPDAAVRPALGPEWDAGQRQHELSRNQAILTNPRATPEDIQIASQRLQEMGQAGAEVTPTPVAPAAPAYAPATPADLVGKAGLVYKGELAPGTDVHQFEDAAYPGMTAALKATDMTSSAAIRDAMNTKLAAFGVDPATFSPLPPVASPTIRNVPSIEPAAFDAEDFNTRMQTQEKWQSQLDNKEIVGQQAGMYADVLGRVRGALVDHLNDVKDRTEPGSQGHIDIQDAAQQLRDQAIDRRQAGDPPLADLALANNLDKRADLLDTVSRSIDAKSPNAGEIYRPNVLTSLRDEVQGFGLSAVSQGRDLTMGLRDFFAPTTALASDKLTMLNRFAGGFEASKRSAANALDIFRRSVSKLDSDAHIDMIDRALQGKSQATPELQAFENTRKVLDKEVGQQAQVFRPGLPLLENHFRMIYKTLPGRDEAGFQTFMGRQRPLSGSGGFLQQRTYDSLREAMAAGGVPITTNPIDLFLLGHADAQRFIHANLLWKEMKESGYAQFVKKGGQVPKGFTTLDDKIANVFFPARSGEGLVSPGKYYVDEGMGRALNNYLGKDYIRQNVLGKAIVDGKNIANGYELLGLRHAVLINAASIAQNLAMAGRRAFNLGQLGGSLKDMIKAPAELLLGNRTVYLEGRDLQAFGAAIDREHYGSEPGAVAKFAASAAGERLLKKYPDAGALLQDAADGRLNMKLSDELRSNIGKSMLQDFADKKYIHAGVKLAPAALNAMNQPLFDYYIPRIKLGMFMRDMSLALQEKAPQLLAGTLTREELARNVANRTENIFGEMNVDKFFWNRTFKTAMQLFYRSVTWRLGTMLTEASGIKDQGKELFNAAKTGRLPKLDPSVAFIGSAILTTAVTSAVIQKIMSGKTPGSMADLTHPQTGDKNDLGRPTRLNIPDYGTEYLKSAANPFQYMYNGRSGGVDRLMEAWKNKGFYGNQIADSNDPKLVQFGARALHVMAPQMIMSSNMDRMQAIGGSKAEGAMSLFGFSPASKDIDKTPAELKAQEIALRSLPDIGRTAGQIAHSQAVTTILTGIQNKRDISKDLKQYFNDGTMQPSDLDNVSKRLTTPFLAQKLQGKDVHMADVLSVYDLASPTEKRQLQPIVQSHLDELAKMTPAIRNQILPRAIAALQGR